MKIYIEYVIFNNLIVNYLILYLSLLILKRKVRHYLVFSSSLIGTIYAVLLPYISFKYDFGIKVVLSLIMCFISLDNHTIKEYVIGLLTFYIITFLFGGIIIGMQNLIDSNIINALIYPNSIGVGLLALSIIIFTIIVKSVLTMLRLVKSEKYYYDVTIEKGGKKIDSIGYLDSGNRLYCNLNPVIILSPDLFDTIVDAKTATKYIDVKTINNTVSKPAYKLDGIKITRDKISKYYCNVFAISADRTFKDYSILLHCDM